MNNNYSAVQIAKYVINKCNSLHHPISNLKLQYVLYYLWIGYYNKTKKYLFSDDFVAWQIGPVVPDAYFEFCVWAGNRITTKFDIDLGDEDKAILDFFIAHYARVSTNALYVDCRRDDKSWASIYSYNKSNIVIPFSTIIDNECRDILI